MRRILRSSIEKFFLISKETPSLLTVMVLDLHWERLILKFALWKQETGSQTTDTIWRR